MFKIKKGKLILCLLVFQTFNFAQFTFGGFIYPDDPYKTDFMHLYTSWIPNNKSEYFQVDVIESGWYVFGINSSEEIESVKFSQQPNYANTEFQLTSNNFYKNVFIAWNHDKNFDKFINLTRLYKTLWYSGVYTVDFLKSIEISLNSYYINEDTKEKYKQYEINGDVFGDYYIGLFYEVLLEAGHTYDIILDDNGKTITEECNLYLYVFRDTDNFLYGGLNGGDDNAIEKGCPTYVYDDGDDAEYLYVGIDDWTPKSTGNYIIVGVQGDFNEFIPSRFYIRDTTENLWEENDLDLTFILPIIISCIAIAGISVYLFLKKKKAIS
ncbi:MAG: hypothetical protein ACP6IY_18280 [Promethearchaeia archaeon]